MEDFKITHYGEPRGFEPTEGEQIMFDIIGEITQEKDLNFVKRSANYVSAAIGPTDVARFKFTKKAKWILLPYIWKDKVYIEGPEEVLGFKEDILKSAEIAKNCK